MRGGQGCDNDALSVTACELEESCSLFLLNHAAQQGPAQFQPMLSHGSQEGSEEQEMHRQVLNISGKLLK